MFFRLSVSSVFILLSLLNDNVNKLGSAPFCGGFTVHQTEVLSGTEERIVVPPYHRHVVLRTQTDVLLGAGYAILQIVLVDGAVLADDDRDVL